MSSNGSDDSDYCHIKKSIEPIKLDLVSLSEYNRSNNLEENHYVVFVPDYEEIANALGEDVLSFSALTTDEKADIFENDVADLEDFSNHLDTEVRLYTNEKEFISEILDDHTIVEDLKISIQNNNINELKKIGNDLLIKHDSIHQAISNNNIFMVNYFINRKLNINVFDIGNNKSPLMLSVKLGYIEISEMLVKNGAVIGSTNNLGDSALHFAAKSTSNSLQSLKLLLNNENMYCTNKFENNILHVASEYGNLEVVKYLLGLSYELNRTNSLHQTALHLSIIGNHNEIALLLINEGIDVNMKDNKMKSALHLSCEYNNIEIFKILINKTNDMYAIDENGDNVLHIACMKGHTAIVLYLLSINYSINLVNHRNGSALHYCVGYKYTEIVKILLDANVDVTIKDSDGRTPLCYSVLAESYEIFMLLIQKGRNDIYDKDSQGNNLLHIASKKECYKIIQYLLVTLKYDLTITNNENQTAYSLALFHHKQNDNILKLFDSNMSTSKSSNNILLSSFGESEPRKLVYVSYLNDLLRNIGEINHTKLADTFHLNDLKNLFDKLNKNKIIEIFKLSLKLASSTRKYWIPYSIRSNGETIFSKYIKYDNIYSTEDCNFELVHCRGSWWFRSVLYQIQLGFFRHLMHSNKHDYISQYFLCIPEDLQDKRFPIIFGFNPIYIESQDIINVLKNDDFISIFSNFNESEEFKKLSKVFNCAIEHVTNNPNEILPPEFHLYEQISFR